MDLFTLQCMVKHEARTQGFYGRFAEKLTNFDRWETLLVLVVGEGIHSLFELTNFIESQNYLPYIFE